MSARMVQASPAAIAAQKKQVKSESRPRASLKSQTAQNRYAAKKQVSPAERQQQLYRALCAQIDGGYFKNAIKSCDRILRIDPHDRDALQTKLFLLLQTEQYGTALALLDDHSAGTQHQEHDFERAYALYRLQREADAAELVKRLKLADGGGNATRARGVLHLEAQLAYRQDDYQRAFDLYTRLLDTSTDLEEHADLTTNLAAAQAHLDFLATGFLHALDVLPASVVHNLETAPPPAPFTSTTSILPVASSSSTPAQKEKAGGQNTPGPHRLRMSRVPKGVVPGVTPPPDPERWLRKSERSTTSYTGVGRRRQQGGATQGSIQVSEPSVTLNASASTTTNVKSGSSKSKKKK